MFIQKKLLKIDDLVSTPSYEMHVLKIQKNENQFIVFNEGLRDVKDYESNTFRTPQ